MIGPRVIVIELHLDLPSPFRCGNIITYRYFETVSCADQDQWSTFVGSLASQLLNSGLGSVPDQTTSQAGISADDLLIELRNIEYGRPLLQECVQDNRLSIARPIAPQRWADYQCDDYFDDYWWSPKKYDRENHLWAGTPEGHFWNGIFDYTRMYEDFEHGFLAVAGSGCDGVDFGYRGKHEGLWAYYPGEGDFKTMAPSISALRDGWCNGKLSL